MTYLLAGVTGGLGNSILAELSETVPPNDIAVLVRSKAKGETFAAAGYDVRIGDYANQDSLVKAFTDIDTLMFVSGTPGQAVSRELQHKNVIEAAKQTGIQQVVYTSLAKAEQSHSVLAPDHIVTESLIKSSGLAYKILRNNWCFENEMGIFKDALDGKGFVYAGGDGKVEWALKEDYAKAAAHALIQTFDTNVTYELSGPLLTYADLHQAFEKATGTTVEAIAMTPEDYKTALTDAGLPEAVVAIVGAIQSDIAAGELDVTSSDLEMLLGHAPETATDAISKLLTKA